MKILITGSSGFFGRNLCETLKTIRDGKNRTRSINIEAIFEYDINTDPALLDSYCAVADFVFNLAGMNRPKDTVEFMEGNHDFLTVLLNTLKKHNNTCPVMLSSSIQASCIGRYDSDYGRSKKAGENVLLQYAEETGAKVLVYRLPNLFGKWCRPNYNSVVATFCNNIANDLPIQVSDPAVELELLYIDDLVEAMLDALEGKEQRCDYEELLPIYNVSGKYCYVPTTHKVTLGEIVELLYTFHAQPKTLIMPEIPEGSFARKLYSTYLSYLPKEAASFPLKMNVDDRGSFTELLRTKNCGQFSVNISKPGITKGQHWHHTKWEFFIVVAGKGLIQQRRIGNDEVLHNNLEKIEGSNIHERLGLEKGKYILLSAHREENIDTEKNFQSLFTAINTMAQKYDMPILYSCHPRSRKRLETSGFQLDARVIQHEPLGFHDYNCLQMNAYAVVSDSGTLPEESSFFTSVGHPFPAVCIRTSTERPEALDKGCFVLAGIDTQSLLQAVDTAVIMNEEGDYGIPVPDYVEENVSTKVVKIIQSYTGVVNKMVWRKELEKINHL